MMKRYTDSQGRAWVLSSVYPLSGLPYVEFSCPAESPLQFCQPFDPSLIKSRDYMIDWVQTNLIETYDLLS
jgi:hypothetical protein